MDTFDDCRQLPGRLKRQIWTSLVVGCALCAVEPVFAETEVYLTPEVLDAGEYGFGWGSRIHQGGLVAWFDSTGEALSFSVTGYDIDSVTEVRVLLNGNELGYLSPGADNGLNDGDTFLLQAQAQQPGLNEIAFITIKPNRVWGATDLLLTAAGENPPAVTLDTPLPDDTFAAGWDVILEASATDDGSIESVAFFAGNRKLAEDSSAPYTHVWRNVPAGSYTLTAVAVDDQMLSSVSEPVSVMVCDDADGNARCDDQSSTSIIDATLATMPPNTWQKININEFQDVWTPLELRPTYASPSQNISGWSGAAWDSRRDSFYIWGGNIGMEEGNEVYAFNATSGMWERGSLPSAVPLEYGVSHRPYVIGGVYDAPLSGESWDNVVYLENMDRLAIIGISRNSNPWRDAAGNQTGPYFWDPAKADPDKVGGSDGTGVDPTTPGGQMWENRDNQVDSGKLDGSSVYVDENGVDVVLFSDTRANLWRYTVDPFDSAYDTWELLATRPASGRNPFGPAAYDPNRNIYVRSGNKPNTLLFWDLNRENEGVFKGETVLLDPDLGVNIKFGEFGMDYDPALDKLVLWGGEDSVLHIDFEDLIDIDETGDRTIRGFFGIEELVPAGMDNPYDTVTEKFTGVFGKWHYMEDKNAYIGVIDPIAGDVYLYKSSDSMPPVSGPPIEPGPIEPGPPTGGNDESDLVLTPGLLDMGEYGFGWGSGVHQGGLVASFQSTGDDLLFDVTGYDIDSNTEVRVLLNGEELGHLSRGTDNGLNGGDTFLLEARAQQAGLNAIEFITIKPNRKWGVTDLLIAQ
jgi:hypothetical protein